MLASCSGSFTTYGTCEEVFENPGENCAEKHGYLYEGSVSTEPDVINPVPLKALGRFRREGATVAPQTSIVYLTEDETEALLYRFVPDKPEHLDEGGRL